MIQLKHGVATDTGNVRPQNEDSYLASSPLFAVADGMGGHNAGEVASALATSLLHKHSVGNTLSTDWLVDTITTINRTIHESAAESIERRGMGTTICALSLVEPNNNDESPQVALANVGDSRIYLSRAGKFRQLSVDHSYVQELVTQGLISEEEARVHPRRNIVTRALGIDDRVAVDTWMVPVFPGDRFILCSDGLVDEVPTADIATLASQPDNPQVIADALVNLAKRNGGRDNITVVVVDAYGDATTEQEPVTADQPPAKRALNPWLISAVVGFVLAVSLFFVGKNARSGYFLDFENSSPSASVCIQRGSSNQVLWFAPTREVCSDLSKNQLPKIFQQRVNEHLRFTSVIDAQRFIAAVKRALVLND